MPKILMIGVDSEMSRGESVYTIPGSYTWVCPAGVTSVSVVAVGGGGGGWTTAGSGGALAYINNYSVTPGSSYSVTVGAGGYGTVNVSSTTGLQRPSATAGGYSEFANASVLKAGGGQITSAAYENYSSADVPGGAVISGTGGAGGIVYASSSTIRKGAGGAGGYAGAGGNNFQGSGYSGSGNAGNGGGGAGGIGYGGAGGGGGGVGIFGQGSNGTAPNFSGNASSHYYVTGIAGGGSGGENGGEGIAENSGSPNYFNYKFSGNGGRYGGGGGGAVVYNKSGNGGGGAVRIIWPGLTRQFPSTDVGTP